jgi:long-chain acyl-CoA synthetase
MILPDLISAQAEEHPEHTALIFRDQPITYGELHRRVLVCAGGLSALGIKKGDTFAFLLRNSPEFIVLSMALSTIGAVAVPINFLEKPDRIALILNDAGAVGVLTAKEFFRHVATAAKKVPSLKHFFLREGEHKEFKDFATLLTGEPYRGKAGAEEEDLMMLLYTSGTTGLPKGVMLTHRNFIANAEQCLAAIRLDRKDRFLCLLPLFHSFSFTTCMVLPFKLGASIVIIESLLPFDPVVKAIWKHHVTLFVAVPQIFSALSSKIRGAKAVVLRVLSPVRLCISGAAPLTKMVHEGFEKTFGTKLLEGYGLTECAPVASLNPEKARKIGTVGKPLPGVDIEIRDDAGKNVPRGDVGEIWIRGSNVMKGYYNKPAETKESLTSDGWLKTGDMGRFDDEGYLSIVDRKKDLIIIKGLNVYPQEVENVIAADASVKEVAVVGKMDPDTGEETIRAFVTAREGQTVDKTALFALCRDNLAAYKRPKEIFVIDEMPKNALQKILKKELRARP